MGCAPTARGGDGGVCQELAAGSTISADGETATVVGEMEVVVVRPADDDGARFWLTIKFPGGETLDVRIARTQLLQQLGIEAGP
jgi:hypothetical protein